MYSRFNLKLSEKELLEIENKFEDLHEDDNYFGNFINKNEISTKLKKIIEQEGVLKSEILEVDCFPQDKFEVFLSHSHKDKQLATKFAQFMRKEMGIKVFLDYQFWEYTDDIIKELINDNSDSIDDITSVTSKINMILTTSLTKMINRTECLIFLNSNNSIDNSYFGDSCNYTDSPWLYYELFISELLKTNKPDRLTKEFGLITESVDIKFQVFLSKMVDMDSELLISWITCYRNKSHKNVLDCLYEEVKKLTMKN